VIRVDHKTDFVFSGLPLKSDQSQIKDTEILASKCGMNVNVAVSWHGKIARYRTRRCQARKIVMERLGCGAMW
jgi:hypothetical protein